MKKIIFPLLLISVFFGCIDKHSDAKEYIKAIDECRLLIDNGLIKDYINTVPKDSNDVFNIFSDQRFFNMFSDQTGSATKKSSYIIEIEKECKPVSFVDSVAFIDYVDYHTRCIKPKLFADLSKSSNKIKEQLKEIEEIVFINDDMGLKSAIKDQLTYNLNMLNKDFDDLDEHFRCFYYCNTPEDLLESVLYLNDFRWKYQKENSLFNKRILDCYKRLADEYGLSISYNELTTGTINVFR